MDPKPGDVNLYPVTPGSGWTSEAVAIGEWAAGAGRPNAVEFYSHATIRSTVNGYQFEAKWPKTGHFQEDSKRVIEVWRIGEPTVEQRVAIIDWARKHEGEWYNMLGLLTGGLLGLSHTAVCSQFVGEAYAAAGIHIGKEGLKLLSPNAIADFHGARCIGRYVPGQGYEKARVRF
jgi:hypothetical protein